MRIVRLKRKSVKGGGRVEIFERGGRGEIRNRKGDPASCSSQDRARKKKTGNSLLLSPCSSRPRVTGEGDAVAESVAGKEPAQGKLAADSIVRAKKQGGPRKMSYEFKSLKEKRDRWLGHDSLGCKRSF